MQCLTPSCTREAAAGLKRGLCMTCHSKAKKMVDAKKTTWDELVSLNMALDVDDGLFEAEFNRRIPKTGDVK